MNDDKYLTMAEMQFLGYSYGRKGYSVVSLVKDMGLTPDEWRLIRQVVSNLLSGSDIEDVDKLMEASNEPD